MEQAKRWHKMTVNDLYQSQTLAAIRDALLPKLLSGAVRIWDAMRAAEAAV